MQILTFITALGCGLVAGMFYAFSSFIMRALGKLPPAQGAAAMQRINIDVINPWFMVCFMGTAAFSIGLIGIALYKREEPGAWLMILGGLLYLLGTFGVTMVCNVPLNNRLAKVDPDTDAAAELWANYLKSWTTWNTVRTVAALAASAALILVLWV